MVSGAGRAFSTSMRRRATLAGPTLAALDDYHVFDGAAVHEAVTFLLDDLPHMPGRAEPAVASVVKIASRARGLIAPVIDKTDDEPGLLAWRVVADDSYRRDLIWAATVGIVLADSSVVTLGLPAILARFDTTVSGVAWVLTSFNIVLAVAVLPAALLAARRGAARAAADMGRRDGGLRRRVVGVRGGAVDRGPHRRAMHPGARRCVRDRGRDRAPRPQPWLARPRRPGVGRRGARRAGGRSGGGRAADRADQLAGDLCRAGSCGARRRVRGPARRRARRSRGGPGGRASHRSWRWASCRPG